MRPNSWGETTQDLGRIDRKPGAERPHLGRTWGGSTRGGSTLGRIDRYPRYVLILLTSLNCQLPKSFRIASKTYQATNSNTNTNTIPINNYHFQELADSYPT